MTLWNLRFLQSPFLTSFERDVFIDALSTPRDVSSGKLLIQEGSFTSAIVMLIEGWACRCTVNKRGKRNVSAINIPGDLCNINMVISERSSFDIRTLTKATVVDISRKKMNSLSVVHPGIAKTITWLAMIEIDMLSQRTTSLGCKSAKERLAHLLCELAVRLGSIDGKKATFSFPLTQDCISDVLGMTAVHVNRTIRALREDGLISFHNRTATLHNVEELRRLSDFDHAYLNGGYAD